MLMRALSVHIAHETAGAARIRHSLRPLISEGDDYLQTSGAMRRGIVDTHSVSSSATGSAEWPPDDRLRRTIQYSRDAYDRTEKPRRTGSPAFAGDDSFVCSSTISVIARSACGRRIAPTRWLAMTAQLFKIESEASLIRVARGQIARNLRAFLDIAADRDRGRGRA